MYIFWNFEHIIYVQKNLEESIFNFPAAIWCILIIYKHEMRFGLNYNQMKGLRSN